MRRTAAAALLLGSLFPLAGSAGTIAVIFQGSGTSVTAPTSGTVFADVVLTVGAGDTPIDGVPKHFELSFDYSSDVSVSSVSPNPPTGWFPLGSPVDDGVGHVENIIVAGDLTGFAQSFLPGASHTVATLELALSGPAVVVGAPTGSSDVILAGGVVDVTHEYTSVPGVIGDVPIATRLIWASTDNPDPNAQASVGTSALVGNSGDTATLEVWVDVDAV